VEEKKGQKAGKAKDALILEIEGVAVKEEERGEVAEAQKEEAKVEVELAVAREVAQAIEVEEGNLKIRIKILNNRCYSLKEQSTEKCKKAG
jgi:hypothetical protein